MDTKKVTSLELSKKLKALGVKQESEFYWYDEVVPVVSTKQNAGKQWDLYCSAFLASEIGEMLPASIQGKRLQLDKMPKGEWFVSYVPFTENSEEEIVKIGYTLPEALGLMLVYLKENKLV